MAQELCPPVMRGPTNKRTSCDVSTHLLDSSGGGDSLVDPLGGLPRLPPGKEFLRVDRTKGGESEGRRG